MHKVINLDSDQVFRHAIKLNLNRNVTNNKFQRGESVREAICDLVVQGKLDATDLKIIHARNCSPMPTNDQVSAMVDKCRRMVAYRIAHIKALIGKELDPPDAM